MNNDRRLLVVGGTGFLGGRLCQRAVADGWDVHATHLTSAVENDGSVGWHRCDITDADAVTSVISELVPTHIINAAYRQSGDAVHAICCDAAETMARAASAIDAKFAHISTDLVFDGNLGRPYVESDPTSPLGLYGEAKTLAEQRVASAHASASIVRTSLIYGAPDAPQERLTRRAHDEREAGGIAFFIDEWRTPVHVEDLAAGVMTLLDTEHSGLIHLAGDERLNRLEFAQLLANGLGLDPTTLVGRTQDPTLGPRAKDVSLNTDLSQTLGIALPGPTKRLRDL